jgi:hypothetical protein
MEDEMADTAVGLFQNQDMANEVAEALRASVFSSDEIRVIATPSAMPVESTTSTPSLDFAAALGRDLYSMGATEQECETYVDGVRGGNALVLATGTRAQADTAIAIMNAYAPIELKEMGGSVAAMPGVQSGDAASPNISLKIEDSRAQSEGARVFTW